MSKFTHCPWFRSICISLVIALVLMDIAWADPSRGGSSTSNLSTQLPTNREMMTGEGKSAQTSILREARILGTVFSIADYVFGNIEKAEKPGDIDFAEPVLSEELKGAAKDVELDGIEFKDDSVPLDRRILIVPFTIDGKEHAVEVGLASSIDQEELAGLEWVKNDKYIAKVGPRNFKVIRQGQVKEDAVKEIEAKTGEKAEDIRAAEPDSQIIESPAVTDQDNKIDAKSKSPLKILIERLRKTISILVLLLLMIMMFTSVNIGCDGGHKHKTHGVTISGRRILVDGHQYFIKGICWHPVNPGDNRTAGPDYLGNYAYDIPLMKAMGINTIRVYQPITEVEVLDAIHAAGMKVIVGIPYYDDCVVPGPDIITETYIDYVEEFKDHEAILTFEIGNEYNKHPDWFNGDVNNWYAIAQDVATIIHGIAPSRIVSTAHGGIPTDDAIARTSNLDVYGVNIYDYDDPSLSLQTLATRTTRPIYISETGADAYNNITQAIDEDDQARATLTIWSHIKDNSDIVNGATFFEWSNEIWKFGDPSSQDTGGWPHIGVPYDVFENPDFWGWDGRKVTEAMRKVWVENKSPMDVLNEMRLGGTTLPMFNPFAIWVAMSGLVAATSSIYDFFMSNGVAIGIAALIIATLAASFILYKVINKYSLAEFDRKTKDEPAQIKAKEAEKDKASAGGSIGSYEAIAIKDVRTLSDGRLEIIALVKAIGDEKEKEIILHGERAPPDAIIWENIAKAGNEKIDLWAMSSILTSLSSPHSSYAIILEKNAYGITGIGTLYKGKPFFALEASVFDNPIAKFHELAHILNAKGELNSKDIMKLVTNKRIRERYYIDRLKKHGYSPKTAPEAVKFHYALRALQRQKFGRDDIVLSLAIEKAMSKEGDIRTEPGQMPADIFLSAMKERWPERTTGKKKMLSGGTEVHSGEYHFEEMDWSFARSVIKTRDDADALLAVIELRMYGDERQYYFPRGDDRDGVVDMGQVALMLSDASGIRRNIDEELMILPLLRKINDPNYSARGMEEAFLNEIFGRPDASGLLMVRTVINMRDKLLEPLAAKFSDAASRKAAKRYLEKIIETGLSWDRGAAILILGALGDESAIDALLDSAHWEHQLREKDIKDAPRKSIPLCLQEYVDVHLAESLGRVGRYAGNANKDKIIRFLVDQLAGRDEKGIFRSFGRRRAAEVLEGLGWKPATDIELVLYYYHRYQDPNNSNNNEEFLKYAAPEIVKLGEDRLIQLVNESGLEEGFDVRNAVALSLHVFNSDEAIKCLMNMTKEPVDHPKWYLHGVWETTRSYAINSLARMDNERAIGLALELDKSGTEEILGERADAGLLKLIREKFPAHYPRVITCARFRFPVEYEAWKRGTPLDKIEEVVSGTRAGGRYQIVRSASNYRTMFINKVNRFIELLGSVEKLSGKIDVAPVTRRMATGGVIARVEGLLAAASRLGEADKPAELEAMMGELKDGVVKYEAYGMIVAMIILARKARRDGRSLIIGLDTSWIPNMKRTGYGTQHDAIFTLMNEIDSLGEKLRKMGYKVEIIHKDSEGLADAILNKAENLGNLSNVVILAPQSAVEAGRLDKLKRNSVENRPFIAGVDSSELEGWKGESGKELYIRIVELVTLALEMAYRPDPPQSPLIKDGSYDKDLRTVIFMPRAEPIDYDKDLKERYKARVTALSSL